MDDDRSVNLTSHASMGMTLTEQDELLLRKYSHTFIGSYQHSLDSKGRLIIPSVFREQLGPQFCIAPSFDFQSIALYPPLMWARVRDRYARLGSFHAGLNKFSEQFDALSYREQECDGQGRILLPSKIRKQILGDEKDMEISGANDHVRIVSREASEQQFTSFMAQLPDIMAAIGELEKRLDEQP